MNLLAILAFFSINLISIVRSDDEVYQWHEDIYPVLTSASSAKFCTGSFRNPPSSVCDPDNILSKKEAINLDHLIEDVKNNSKCICDKCPPGKRGLNIKLALVKFAKINRNVSVDISVEIFAEKTRRKWRFGGDCSNDVLIFFSALDDKIYISMGSRARNVISEEDIQTILKETRTHFTSGDYYQGLESIIATLQDLSDNYTPKASKLSLGSIMLIVVGVICAIIIVLFAVYWLCIKKDNNSTKGSFEFIGSWGRNRNKNKPKRVQTPALRPKIEHIYQPVHTTEKIDSGDTTLAMSAKEQIS